MRNTALGFALIAIVMAAPAQAAPTYLACVLSDGGAGGGKIDVVADEALGTVTTRMPNGYTERLVAVFSPSAVDWKQAPPDDVRYSLNRTDLSIARVLSVGDESWTEKGSCKLQETPKRAF